MVSRSCCSRAYARLFASVVLDLFIGPYGQSAQREAQALQKFASILNSSLAFPQLGMVYHIHSFSFALHTHNPPTWNELTKINEILDAGGVSLILDALHGPTYGVKFFGFRAARYCWQDYTKLGPKLISALHGILHSPHLRRVSLCGFSNAPEILFKDVCIEILELYCSQHSKKNSVHAASNCLAPLMDLKQLCINLELPSGLQQVIEMPLSAANTLQALHLNLASLFSGDALLRSLIQLNRLPKPAFPFHLLHELTSLRLLNSYAQKLDQPWVVRALSTLLMSCTLPPSLRLLSIESSAWVPWPHPVEWNGYSAFSRAEWEGLNTLLVRPAIIRIPSVEIALTCRVDNSNMHDPDIFTDYDAHAVESDIRDQLTALLHGFIGSRECATSSCLSVALTRSVHQMRGSIAPHIFDCLKTRFGTENMLNADLPSGQFLAPGTS